ncbi:MAG: autotransporter domain-containing protein [Hyphomicrobiales bacterium]|nr:autotransporter domain-containing protein [Hyphomicrobiales bacterium]
MALLSFVSRRGLAPSLLATTSVAALFIATSLPASAGKSIKNTTAASVSNAQGQATTSIVISGSTVTGAVTNAGTISATAPSPLSIVTSTVGGGISNTGTITSSGSGARGVNIGPSSTIFNGIANGQSGVISATGSGQVTALSIGQDTVSGGVTNNGQITASTTTTVAGALADANAIAVFGGGSNFSGGINNAGGITVNSQQPASGPAFATGILVQGGIFSGGVTNTGSISAQASGSNQGAQASGISLTAEGAQANGNSGSFAGSIFSGDLALRGSISASASANSQLQAASAFGLQAVAQGGGLPTANALATGGTFTGNITNSGSITVASANSGQVFAVGILATAEGGGSIEVQNGKAALAKSSSTGGLFTGSIANSGTIAVSAVGSGSGNAAGVAVNFTSPSRLNGVTTTRGTFGGSISNTGTISATASGSGVSAFGIQIGNTANHVVEAGIFTGSVSNSGTITSVGQNGATGVGIKVLTPVAGGVTNTGTITGSSAAIDLSQELGGGTVVTQAGGLLNGSVIGSGNANADMFNLTGGRVTLSPGQSIAGFGSFTQTGGTLALNVTTSNAAGSFPTISAGNVVLRGGNLLLVPQANSLFALATTPTTFRNIIAATNSLTGSFSAAGTTTQLLGVSLTPDPTTANALDATLSLNRTALAASSLDLTQDLRLGLDAPQVLTQAVQDRLIASGGVLGDGPPNAAGNRRYTRAAAQVGELDFWARGFDQFGSASGTGTGYDVNRAAPLIGGFDWRFGNGIVVGLAGTYVESTASFKDGTHTTGSSYQGAAYAGWAGGPWYALGSGVVSINNFATTRQLGSLGLPGVATSTPTGQSYQAHAESGYHWLLPTSLPGRNIAVTPYAALDFVAARSDSFNETGGFGALGENAADSNSFSTTLGVRVTSKMSVGAYGFVEPELRIGWNHEFLDSSQTIGGSLLGVPGSSFSATGIDFGRDSALVGAGLSADINQNAKVFMDYDGKINAKLQEHSVSGGMRVRF